jgi:hypothetical protein
MRVRATTSQPGCVHASTMPEWVNSFCAACPAYLQHVPHVRWEKIGFSAFTPDYQGVGNLLQVVFDVICESVKSFDVFGSRRTVIKLDIQPTSVTRILILNLSYGYVTSVHRNISWVKVTCRLRSKNFENINVVITASFRFEAQLCRCHFNSPVGFLMLSLL